MAVANSPKETRLSYTALPAVNMGRCKPDQAAVLPSSLFSSLALFQDGQLVHRSAPTDRRPPAQLIAPSLDRGLLLRL